MAMKKTAKVTKRAVQIVPENGWVKKQKSNLPRRFPPYQLKRIDPDSIDEHTVSKIRELTNKQIDSLLGALGFERTMPNAWERAFFRLAVIHYGAAHITWTPPRGPNRRAQKRTSALDEQLEDDVRQFMAEGCTETQALEKIAKDPAKCAKLRLSKNPRSETPDWKRHFHSLKKRMAHIKNTTPLERLLLRAFGSDFSTGGIETDYALWLAASKESVSSRENLNEQETQQLDIPQRS